MVVCVGVGVGCAWDCFLFFRESCGLVANFDRPAERKEFLFGGSSRVREQRAGLTYAKRRAAPIFIFFTFSFHISEEEGSTPPNHNLFLQEEREDRKEEHKAKRSTKAHPIASLTKPPAGGARRPEGGAQGEETSSRGKRASGGAGRRPRDRGGRGRAYRGGGSSSKQPEIGGGRRWWWRRWWWRRAKRRRRSACFV